MQFKFAQNAYIQLLHKKNSLEVGSLTALAKFHLKHDWKKPNNQFGNRNPFERISVDFSFGIRRCEKLFLPFRVESSNVIWFCAADSRPTRFISTVERLLLFRIILYINFGSIFFCWIPSTRSHSSHRISFRQSAATLKHTFTRRDFSTCRCRELIELEHSRGCSGLCEFDTCGWFVNFILFSGIESKRKNNNNK